MTSKNNNKEKPFKDEEMLSFLPNGISTYSGKEIDYHREVGFVRHPIDLDMANYPYAPHLLFCKNKTTLTNDTKIDINDFTCKK